jgi:ABC-type polysaccharide/polyol phosphate transport system ATPase subunit
VDDSRREPFIDVPIKNYSSGMYMCLAVAIVANLNLDILLLDEIFASAMPTFSSDGGTVEQFVEDGKTTIFVSHAPAAIRALPACACSSKVNLSSTATWETGQQSLANPRATG